MQGNKTNHPKRGGYYTGGSAVRVAKRRLKEDYDEKEPFVVLVTKMRETAIKASKCQFYWRHILCRYFLYDNLKQADFRWIVTNCNTGAQATIRPRDYRGCKGGIKWNAMASAAKRV